MKSLEELLISTSRTFAITIPYLPDLTRREVTLAYLLLRIADTMEDGILWSITDRLRNLGELVDFLADPASLDAVALAIQWCDTPPCRHVEYLELLGSFPQVVAEIQDLEPAASTIIFQHAKRVASGMALSLANPPYDLNTLRQYCYYVAGIVGELITELILLRVNATTEEAERLRKLAILYGEGLQLVNILKDVDADASEGRHYLPAHLDKQEVFKLARRDLEAASEYSKLLQVAHAPVGVVLFTAIPTAFAQATLLRIERFGPGAKLTRPEVAEIRNQVESLLRQA